MDDYVSKPVKIDDLKGAIERYREILAAAEKSVHIPAALPEEEMAVPDASNVIDHASLAALKELDADGGDGVFAQIVQAFLENTPTLIAEARVALMQGQAGEVSRLTHTLKGSCSNFGAERLRDACMILELRAGEGVLDGADSQIDMIEQEFMAVRHALENELPTHAA
jgi:HPt (histidine-containing phosphotransfer) domain-containing protein